MFSKLNENIKSSIHSIEVNNYICWKYKLHCLLCIWYEKCYWTDSVWVGTLYPNPNLVNNKSSVVAFFLFINQQCWNLENPFYISASTSILDPNKQFSSYCGEAEALQILRIVRLCWWSLSTWSLPGSDPSMHISDSWTLSSDSQYICDSLNSCSTSFWRSPFIGLNFLATNLEKLMMIVKYNDENLF